MPLGYFTLLINYVIFTLCCTPIKFRTILICRTFVPYFLRNYTYPIARTLAVTNHINDFSQSFLPNSQNFVKHKVKYDTLLSLQDRWQLVYLPKKNKSTKSCKLTRLIRPTTTRLH